VQSSVRTLALSLMSDLRPPLANRSPHPEISDAEQLRQAVKSLEDLKFALDASAIVAITDAAGVITYVNDTFCQISQYSREELVGKTHQLVNSGYHPKKFFKTMWQTISDGQVWKGEIRNRAKDGHDYWVDTTIVPLLTEEPPAQLGTHPKKGGPSSTLTGKPYQYVAIRYDITPQKQLEEALRQLNEDLEHRVQERTEALATNNRELKKTILQLKSAEEQRETFVAALTHDLRTPLIAQKRALELMVGQKDKLPTRLVGLTERLAQSNEDLLAMVNKLLEIHQYQAGKVSLAPEAICLASLVQECFHEVGIIAETQNLTLRNKVSNELPTLWADRSQIKRVLMNLIGNALENIPNDCFIEVTGAHLGHALQLNICDNGPGIPEDVRASLFEPYVTIHRTRKKIGSGLGLSICKMIVERHGGTITMKDHTGGGTCFIIALPLVQSL
jgi:PAS domain S-box-containing protein